MDDETARRVIAYHERSKHHYDRYARSPGYMDWQNQPDPFRFYTGKAPLPLPLPSRDPKGGYGDLYSRRGRAPQPVTIESIGAFLALSLGLSAWKATADNRWSLRMNPSSGNLHPTEAHLVLPAADGLNPGIYHYNPLLHGLEPRARLSADFDRQLWGHLGAGCFLVTLTSIFWRESWKYGERAFRYCNHDVGHAVAGLSISANLQGWQLVYLSSLSDDQIAAVIGLDRTAFAPLEEEYPDLLCLICPGDRAPTQRELSKSLLAGFRALDFGATPSQLSREQVNWDVIYRTAGLTRKPQTPHLSVGYRDRGAGRRASSDFSAAEIIRKRRSAVRFDPRGRISRDTLFTILDHTLPRNGIAPFDSGPGPPAVNLLTFAHRVDGLEQGLYLFLRCPDDLAELRRICRGEFLWTPAQEGFPLYLLKSGDYRREAMRVSCNQEIAGESAVSFGMIARFAKYIQPAPYRYRHLFWEAGMIGQVLYLEAEAHGKRGTGIGCFFDDAVHDLLGFEDNRHQSLYHFTLGDPLEDPRLKTRAPYGHLDGLDRKTFRRPE